MGGKKLEMWMKGEKEGVLEWVLFILFLAALGISC